ncbi:MAG TPA: AHH domain-containing protein [Longimicrobium sp.]|nr:AHH domain-containing protein [Longimicrobium sp.]
MQYSRLLILSLLALLGTGSAAARGADAAGGTAASPAAARAPGAPRAVRARALAPATPVVSVADVNPGTTLERDMCLTVAAADGAAYECGDLRLAHAFPAVRTLGRGRAPSLLYNSQHAHPRPIVFANVTLPAGADVPTSVEVVGTLGGLPASGSWNGSAWPAGGTRRVGLQWDGLSLSTGVHAYSLQVTFWYGTTPYRSGTVTGETVVVNRSTSPYGAGWWPAGVEQLTGVDMGRVLWVGGDGSTRVYTSLSSDKWVAAALERPDTIYPAWVAPYVHRYRRLPNGTLVWFDEQARHYATQNRLNHVTRFHYDSTRLARIELPQPGGAPARWYDFEYNHPGNRLSRVVSRGTGLSDRATLVNQLDAALGRVAGFTDPDGKGISYGYATTGSLRRVAGRTDRRGAVTTFGYDAAERLAWSSLDLQDGRAITARYYSIEGWLGPRATSRFYTILDGPRSDVNDSTTVYVNPMGAPTRVRDPLGAETRIWRDDPRFPGLATMVRTPGGLVTRAWYDALGRLDSTRVENPLDDGRNAVTRYAYDDWWPYSVSQVTAPGGEVTLMEYDPQTGNRAWQQQGPSAARRVHFAYHPLNHATAPGLLATATYPATATQPAAVEGVEYDALGNLSATVSPTGLRAEVLNDGLGRAVRTRAPIDQDSGVFRTDTTVYGAMDQVLETYSLGPPVAYASAYPMAGDPGESAAEQVTVVNTYDDELNLLSVSRSAAPDLAGIGTVTTQYRYDLAGRKVAEIAPDGQVDSTYYDPAGNVVKVRTRRFVELGGQYLEMQYDALNRLVRRIVPGVVHADTTETVADATYPSNVWHFPRFGTDAEGNATVPNTGGGLNLVIRADTAEFVFDSIGRMVQANNRDARISRTYFRGGAIRTDTLRIRTYAGNDFSQHVYGLSYDYGVDGRRVGVGYPVQLGVDGVGYEYDPVTGALSRVVQTSGGVDVAYAYDVQGRLERVTYGGGVRSEEYAYDLEGRMVRRFMAGIHADTLVHDDRGKVVRVRTLGDSTVNGYSGLGNLVRSYTDRFVGRPGADDPEEIMSVDALGNVVRDRHASPGSVDVGMPTGARRHLYHPGSGRLRAMYNVDSWSSTTVKGGSEAFYDSAGNKVFSADAHPIDYEALHSEYLIDRTALYYGADDRLRAVDRRGCVFGMRQVSTYQSEGVCAPPPNTAAPAFEEYRYDALGRRVLVRTDQDWACANNCVKGLTRTVWDGDQVLHEIRAPMAHAEQDTGAVLTDAAFPRQYGRVAYVFGAGLDAPVALYRFHVDTLFENPVVVHPLTTWRGDYDIGLYTDGTPTNNGTNGEPTRCVEVPLHQGDNDPAENDLPDDPDTGGGQVIMTKVCLRMSWPAPYLWMSHAQRGGGPAPDWWGSLIHNKRDASGQLYMRNRYYDPQSGRFTQEDPIGIAGGLNVYGFAAGDPVSYGDPYGLNPCRRLRGALVAGAAMAAGDLVLPVGDLAGAACIGMGILGSIAAAIGANEAAESISASSTSSRPRQRRMQIHHIATDKNERSSARGGPWTPRFEPLFERAGLSMNDPRNKVAIEGHFGPHPEAYHRAVYDRLVQATRGLTGRDYSRAFEQELREIGTELQTRGTALNRMIAR